MQIYSRLEVAGNQVGMVRTSKQHFDDRGRITQPSDDPVAPFAQVLFNAVENVNQLQQNADELEEKMAVSPEEVDIHEVMIASEKARLGITFMKTIVEKAIRAYNDLVTMR